MECQNTGMHELASVCVCVCVSVGLWRQNSSVWPRIMLLQGNYHYRPQPLSIKPYRTHTQWGVKC